MDIRESIAEAGIRAAANGSAILDELYQSAGTDRARMARELAQKFNYSLLDLQGMRQISPAFDVLPYADAMRRRCVLLRNASGLVGVISDPFDNDLISWLEFSAGALLQYVLALPEDLDAFLMQYEEQLRIADPVLSLQQASHEGGGAHAEEISLRTISDDQHPIVKLVNSTLYDALKVSASDIHLESTPNGLVIKYRIDGVLSHIGGVASSVAAEQVISRIKILAELDIGERRIPQDGRFKVIMDGREVDFRVSIMPSIFGEDAVLRVLDKKALSDELQGLTLQSLGFGGCTLDTLHELAVEPYGMLLVTGPTGSGKTTTLYAMISEVNNGLDKIITIEDPVEYQLGGVLQIPVNEKKGLSFSRGLRSILRHDPDKIMVGEVRDPDTAEIAVQAALTGHLVLTTVHANNVFDVIGRFIHMGVDPYSFVSAVNAILAQRLVRMNCVHCNQSIVPSKQLLAVSRLTEEQVRNYTFMKGGGCAICRGSGYKGRQAISELLVLTDEIREMIVARAPIRQLKEVARRNGMASLRESALELASAGRTTLEEINRVTFSA